MSPARGSRVEADLADHISLGTKLKRGNVAGDVERVGAGCREEVFLAMRQEYDVAAIHFEGKTWRDEGVGDVCEDWHVCRLINHVDGDSVSSFHEGVEVA